MEIKIEKYWIRIKNDRNSIVSNEDGKWVAFPRTDYSVDATKKRPAIIEKVSRVLERCNLQSALITQKHLDIIEIFTSSDRIEIWKVKQVIKSELNLSDDSLIWKAEFETDNDWKHRQGNLYFLSELLTAVSKKEYHLRHGWHRKADRIEEKQIVPLIGRFRQRLLEENMENRKSMVIKPAFPSVDYNIDPTLVFVLMPFNEAWSADVYHLIKKAGENLGLKVARADDIFEPDIIMNDIWKMINKAGLIVADITVHNANVFYEIGIAHTLGRKVVLIRQEVGEKAPFDIAYWRCIDYGISPLKAEEFKKSLINMFQRHLDRVTIK